MSSRILASTVAHQDKATKKSTSWFCFVFQSGRFFVHVNVHYPFPVERRGTIPLAEDEFYWHFMKRDIAGIVLQCRTCRLVKFKKQNTSLYTSLLIPHTPYRDLSMDFVLELPKTTRKHAYFEIT